MAHESYRSFEATITPPPLSDSPISSEVFDGTKQVTNEITISEFAKKLDSINNEINLHQQKIERLKNLRSELLLNAKNNSDIYNLFEEMSLVFGEQHNEQENEDKTSFTK